MFESENFNRLLRLIVKGSTMVLRNLLVQFCAPLSISEYLYKHQDKVIQLNFFENQYQLVAEKKVESMDITLLCKLLFGLFKDELSSKLKSNLDAIKKLRDDFLHSETLEKASVDEKIFIREWDRISSLLKDTVSDMSDESCRQKIEQLIQNTRRGEYGIAEVEDLIKELYGSQEETCRKVENVLATLEELKIKQVKMEGKFVSKLDELKGLFSINYKHNATIDVSGTHLIEIASSHLLHSYSVFLYGKPGEGKTTTAFYLVKCLSNLKEVDVSRCAMLFDPDDLKAIKPGEIDLLLIDDIFGKYNAERNKVIGWRQFFETLDNLQKTFKTRVITTSRMHIFLECKHELKTIGIFSNVVNLDSLVLSTEEKKQILSSQMKASGKSTDVAYSALENYIHYYRPDYGFPLYAHQCAIDEAAIHDVLAKPIQTIMEQIIRSDDVALETLLYVFYLGNAVKISQFDITKIDEKSKQLLAHVSEILGMQKPVSTFVREVTQKLRYFQGSFLKAIDGVVSFMHDTMYEAIAHIHAEEFPLEVIQYCTTEFFCQSIRLTDENNTGYIIVDEDDYVAMVNRCINEVIHNGNGQRISRHPMFDNHRFVRLLLRELKENDEQLKLFFSRGTSLNHAGIHAFYYHAVENQRIDYFLLNEIGPILKCDHDKKCLMSCWKCQLKAEAIAAACSANRSDLYTKLKEDGAEVTQLCLYRAVENQTSDLDLIKRIIHDLKEAERFLVDLHDLQFCLGMAMKHTNNAVYTTLKEAGVNASVHSLYYAVQLHDKHMLSMLIDDLKREKRWKSDNYYLSRALTEAYVTDDQELFQLLNEAGAKLTESAVFWAIKDHKYDQVAQIVNLLKQNSTFDVEAYGLATAMALARKKDDRRVIQFLINAGVAATTSSIIAMVDLGASADEIKPIIDELKLSGKWDINDRKIAAAYLASCGRAESKIRELLSSEGVTITPACLGPAVRDSIAFTENVLKVLKENGTFDPANRYIAKALVWAIEFKDRTMENILIEAGLCMNMACLVAAAKSSFSMSTLERVIGWLRKENKFDPESDLALESLNIASTRKDLSAYDKLRSEGITWKSRSLFLAVQYETVEGLKLVIEHLRKRNLLDKYNPDVRLAIEHARASKNMQKYDLLLDSNLV